jgi:purine-binding chemotaxis protein CheW
MTTDTADRLVDYVTATVGGQLFGLPIGRVRDVFVPGRIVRVPLAPPDVAGVLNVRGRVMTMIDMRRRLAFDPAGDGGARMAIGVDCGDETYGLLIDAVGEVLSLAAGSREDNPVNLDARLAQVAAGVHRLGDQLLVILDVDGILDVGADAGMARVDKPGAADGYWMKQSGPSRHGHARPVKREPR